MKIRVIDFETTGMEPPVAAVCEVGTCDLNTDGVVAPDEPRSWLCRVDTMPPEVRAVHHISLAECEPWPPFDAEPIHAGWPVALAAHNAEFEARFFTPLLPMICTYKAALRVWPEAPSHSNGALRYWLEDAGKIAPVPRLCLPSHRAGPDAYVTANILVALMQDGATVRDMIAWTTEPAVMPTCPLGKFRGKKWGEVDAGFLGWMLRQPTMEADLVWNARREIARREGRNV